MAAAMELMQTRNNNSTRKESCLMQSIARDMVLSMGSNCAISFNLRHFYLCQKTGLLDWVITPLSCLPDLIANRFNLVNKSFKDSLEHVQWDGGESIQHIPTGMLLHHAFPRDRRQRILPGWMDEADRVAEKFSFLGKRMNDWLLASRSPAIFLNGTGDHEAMTDHQRKKNSAADIYVKIMDSFRDAYPNSDPIYCILHAREEDLKSVQFTLNTRIASVKNYGNWHQGYKGHYAGCITGWKEALGSLCLHVQPAEHRVR